MIRNILAAAALVLTATLSASCGYFQAREQRGKLADIRVGMSKEQVREIAGNPLEKELFGTDDLWYYYTDPKWYDGLVTQDECTPFVFVDERHGGWGHDYYHQSGSLSSWTQKAINSAVWF
jgi:hypothetical protein